MSTLPLLIELGTEELPPKALPTLAQSLKNNIIASLDQLGIEHGIAQALWSPRRLAVLVKEVTLQQPDVAIEKRGPALQAGLNAQGQPTPALQGFAKSCGTDTAQLEQLTTDKGTWFVYRSMQQGKQTIDLIPDVVRHALKQLPIPKPMRWGDQEEQFIRPVHWLVMLLGESIIPGKILGLSSNRISHGHRFHHPQPVVIQHADQYIHTLREAHVLVDAEERQKRIAQLIEVQADAVQGHARVNENLLIEVTNLVEWPEAILCTFDSAFLQIPADALITTMEANQKFFPILNKENQLTANFIGIANIHSKHPEEIRKGYERVIRPRFADAQFFYQEDLKTPLEQQQVALGKVTYHQRLGSVWDKVLRVTDLARTVANRLVNVNRQPHTDILGTTHHQHIEIDPAAVVRAASLSKCDLMTRMVGEFPELQGVMGRCYALAQGETPDVANALDEFYAPRFASDHIAKSKTGQIVAMAEKLDTLAGMFSIGQLPTGNKDPFSLRRNALGLARTIIEGKLDLDLLPLILDALTKNREAAEKYGHKNKEDINTIAEKLHQFILERLRGYYAEKNISGDILDAVFAVQNDHLYDADRRIGALLNFIREPAWRVLAAANKRIANILKQARSKNESITHIVNSQHFEDTAESTLWQAMDNAMPAIQQDAQDQNYANALQTLTHLSTPIDTFFEHVMVMVENPEVRNNRLELLNTLRNQFLSIADIGLLQVDK